MNTTVKRSISGIVFLAVFLCGLLLDKYLFAVLFIFMMVGMLHEFYRMTMGNSFKYSRILATVAGVILFVLIFCAMAYNMTPKLTALALVPVIIIMATSIYTKDRSDFSKFSHIYTGLLYIAIPLSMAPFIMFGNDEFDGMPMLCFFIIIWASDVGAYCFGITLGKKFGGKLFPSISPNKSWAGFWGGMLCSVVASIILHFVGLFRFPWYHCVILAVIMDVAGVYGDLFESQWKRVCGVKDSGKIIPGHGGLLDRFDSTLFAVPVGVLYLMAFDLM
jgi:phosphatidate cytidylyltransferase